MWFAQSSAALVGREPWKLELQYIARVNFLNGGVVLKLDVTRANCKYYYVVFTNVADLDYLENGEHGDGLRF